MNSIALGYARLARPANLPTAAADILAGLAIALFVSDEHWFLSFPWRNGVYLALASVLLYAGGVAFNDVCDAKIDSLERPERPIPSGLISIKSATIFSFLLFSLGVFSAFLVNNTSGLIAIILFLSILSYDAVAKNNGFLGPLNMGVCRGLNLILGMSVIGMPINFWFALVPIVYIFAITLISRGEVHGGNKAHIIWAAVLYAVVILSIIGIIVYCTNNITFAIPFLGLFIFLIYKPLFTAYKLNTPVNIKKAVIGGVLSIIVLDAALAVGFGVWWYGILILLLLPLSILLSKLFAVT